MAQIAVIGGGIAGAACALALAHGGVPPVWLAPPPLEGPKPGEHLSAAARPMLASLGAADLMDSDAHRPGHTLLSAWSGPTLAERNAILHLEGPPNVLNRRQFEADLAARAEEAGAQRIAAQMTDVQARGGAWQVQTADGEIEASLLIDATGRAARVAGRTGCRFQADRLVGLHLSLRSMAAPRPLTLIEAVRSGWWYLTVLPNGGAMLIFFTDSDLLPRAMTRDASDTLARAKRLDHIGAFLDAAGLEPAEARPRLASAQTSWIAPACGAGWIAIGDAAAAFDPVSSHGMTTALWTATTVAKAILAQDRSSVERYAKEVALGVQDFLAGRRETYAQVRRFSDSPFWQRRAASAPAEAAEVVVG
ncbi:MAG: glycine oxidase maturase GoxB [Pseudomonadota bacterium]